MTSHLLTLWSSSIKSILSDLLKIEQNLSGDTKSNTYLCDTFLFEGQSGTCVKYSSDPLYLTLLWVFFFLSVCGSLVWMVRFILIVDQSFLWCLCADEIFPVKYFTLRHSNCQFPLRVKFLSKFLCVHGSCIKWQGIILVWPLEHIEKETQARDVSFNYVST